MPTCMYFDAINYWYHAITIIGQMLVISNVVSLSSFYSNHGYKNWGSQKNHLVVDTNRQESDTALAQLHILLP